MATSTPKHKIAGVSRTTWNGTINFGLISVAVGTAPTVSEKDVRFSNFVSVDGELHSVGNLAYDKVTGEPLEADAEKVRCYMYSATPVPVSDEDLADLAPLASKSIDLEEFVNVEDVDPVYFGRHEVAIPALTAGKPYALLVKALEASGKAGIGRTVRRSKEHLVMVRAVNGLLRLTFLNYHDEVKELGSFDDAPALKDAEVDMALNLINALSADWQPEKYEDTQRERVLEMIANKANGLEIEAPAPTAEETVAEFDDVMALMKASIEAAANR